MRVVRCGNTAVRISAYFSNRNCFGFLFVSFFRSMGRAAAPPLVRRGSGGTAASSGGSAAAAAAAEAATLLSIGFPLALRHLLRLTTPPLPSRLIPFRPCSAFPSPAHAASRKTPVGGSAPCPTLPVPPRPRLRQAPSGLAAAPLQESVRVPPSGCAGAAPPSGSAWCGLWPGPERSLCGGSARSRPAAARLPPRPRELSQELSRSEFRRSSARPLSPSRRCPGRSCAPVRMARARCRPHGRRSLPWSSCTGRARCWAAAAAFIPGPGSPTAPR